MIAAWIPARDAARVDPVQALQKGKHQILTEGENRIRRMLAIVTALLAAICLIMGLHNRALFYIGLHADGGRGSADHAHRLHLSREGSPTRSMRAIRPVEGTLAVDSLIQAPRRTSGAVAALMLSLALVISLAGMAKASYTNIRTWLDIALNPDLVVTGRRSSRGATSCSPPRCTANSRRCPASPKFKPFAVAAS